MRISVGVGSSACDRLALVIVREVAALTSCKGSAPFELLLMSRDG